MPPSSPERTRVSRLPVIGSTRSRQATRRNRLTIRWTPGRLRSRRLRAPNTRLPVVRANLRRAATIAAGHPATSLEAVRNGLAERYRPATARSKRSRAGPLRGAPSTWARWRGCSAPAPTAGGGDRQVVEVTSEGAELRLHKIRVVRFRNVLNVRGRSTVRPDLELRACVGRKDVAAGL